ncbi:hypothetical protein [Plantactinospora sp. CA-290183]|uniref:hypothetical protein n=1 Tax=Plantactinospora sp. CA-290183 TaxID=3240006 RepID=UPI003D8D7839
MKEVVNLTPHSVAIYPSDTPDRIEPGSVIPLRVIEPSEQYQAVRLEQRVIRDDDLHLGIPVQLVDFGSGNNGVTPLPPMVKGTYYLVPLVVGLAAFDRHDLLVCHDTVRNTEGSIMGARKLARPRRP